MKKCLVVLLGIAWLASAPARVAGQDPVGVCKDARGCEGSSNSGSGGGSRERPSRDDARRSAALELNDKGIAAGSKGDLAAAVSFFEQALKNSPNDVVIRQNLANARLRLAKSARDAEEKKGEALSKVAADRMQQSIQDITKTLSAAPSKGGLDFDGGTGSAPSVGNSGGLDVTTVVDSRGPRSGADLLAKVPELAASPAADRIAKGFTAVVNHDWPVALAWWQDALNRDPKNASLLRSVELARWMVEFQRRDRQPSRKPAPPVPGCPGGPACQAEAPDWAVQMALDSLVPAARPPRPPVPGCQTNPHSAECGDNYEMQINMMLQTVRGAKPMPTIDMSDEWWRDHGK